MARERSAQGFKDYFLIMQVHPEADAGIIGAAYWHLARRYQEEAQQDATARQKLDDLNEAYSVLGSAARREEYMRLRAEALGEGALPTPPGVPAAPDQPLSVMRRQRPRPREAPAEEPPPPRRSRRSRALSAVRGPWPAVFVAASALGGGAVGLAVVLGPVLAGVVVGAAVLAVAAGLLWRAGWLRPAGGVSRPGLASKDPDALRQATEEMRSRLRESAASPDGPTPSTPRAAAQPAPGPPLTDHEEAS